MSEFSSIYDVSRNEFESIAKNISSRIPFGGKSLKAFAQPSTQYLVFTSQPPSTLQVWRDFISYYELKQIVLWRDERETQGQVSLQLIDLSGYPLTLSVTYL